MTKLFSLKRVQEYLKNYRAGYGSGELPMDMQMIQQLANTMRENERLHCVCKHAEEFINELMLSNEDADTAKEYGQWQQRYKDSV